MFSGLPPNLSELGTSIELGWFAPPMVWAPRPNVSQNNAQRLTAHSITVHTITLPLLYTFKSKFQVKHFLNK